MRPPCGWRSKNLGRLHFGIFLLHISLKNILVSFLDRHPHGGLMTPQNVGVDFFHFVLKSE